MLYVVPSDVPDRALDTDGEIVASVESWQRWLRSQTGGRGIRLDTFQGALDVSFVRLATSSAAGAIFPTATYESELKADGFDAPNKLYAVYYDGASMYACGDGGAPYPSVYLLGSDSRSGTTCVGQPIGQSPPSYLDFSLLHELVHSLGFVRDCAPHAIAGSHVGDSPYDLMWGGGPWADLTRMQLDVGHDDYFQAFVPGCADLAANRFLEGGGATLDLQVSNEGGATGDVVVTAVGRLSVTCAGGGCPSYFDTWPAPTVTLTAEIHSVTDLFAGWGGACGDDSFTCTVTMDSSKQIVARFVSRAPVPLRVAVSGSGRVTGGDRAIFCRPRCSASFVYGTPVELRARPARGWRLARWRNADECAGRSLTCALVMTDPVSVRATFTRRTRTVR